MQDHSDLNKLAEAVAAAAALTEAVFLGAGTALEAPIESLARMTAKSELVLADLAGETLGRSLEALSRAASLVDRMGKPSPDEAARFHHLDALATGLAVRIGKMTSSLDQVDPLAINARIVSAGIRAQAADFSTFADDIARTLTMTRDSLREFATELRAVRGHIAAARAGQSAFHTRREADAASIPARLGETIDAIARQHARAAAASAAVRQSSHAIRDRIRDAIMALQIGDITRQRLEHARDGLILLTRTLTGPDSVSPGPSDDAAPRRALTGLICRLLGSQIVDAAAEFERDVALMVASLSGLCSEARGLRGLATAASGAAGRGAGERDTGERDAGRPGGGTVIADLEARTGEALALFQGFGAARAEAMDIMAAVGGAAASLCGHLRDVQSREADIRIMGLNTTFRCARIGPEGRPLSLIAQQLRTYADGFAKEAGALIHEVEMISQLTRALSDDGGADAAPAIAEVVQAMTGAIATLRQMGLTLGAALGDLDGESERVVAFVDETASRLAGHRSIALAMHQAVDALTLLAQEAGYGPEDQAGVGAVGVTTQAERLLGQIAAAYTMVNERVVHDRFLGRAAAPLPSPDLEELLF
jgi:ABC-type transporter Mla subunit MlaD